jgi:RNA polymerase sigma-70 factor (family 1)
VSSLQKSNIRLLFDLIADGDTVAYETLYHAYFDPIFSTALVYGKTRELAQDVTQQVFLSVWEKRADLKNVSDPTAWLHTAARFQVMHAFRKKYYNEKYLEHIRKSASEKQDNLDDQLIQQQQQELIAKIVTGLPSKQLEIYRLSREQGLTYIQIAGQLGLSRETIKDYMAQALKNIRKSLETYRNDLIIIIMFSLFQTFF